MKQRTTAVCGTALTMAASLVGGQPVSASRLVNGPVQRVEGQPVRTWERLGPRGAVTEVGVTLPLALVQRPPAKPGAGPLGAIAVVGFPRTARSTTYFDHFEMHWNPNGHPPACCQGVPHFDLHFYGVPLQTVWRVPPRDTAPPKADRMPAGYIYPGADQCVPQMGVHAMLPKDLAPGRKMTANMVAGFWNGRMTFIEPMVSRATLLKRRTFRLDVPRPRDLGRHTRYPTTFTAAYDPKADSYRLTFGGFREMH